MTRTVEELLYGYLQIQHAKKISMLLFYKNGILFEVIDKNLFGYILFTVKYGG